MSYLYNSGFLFFFLLQYAQRMIFMLSLYVGYIQSWSVFSNSTLCYSRKRICGLLSTTGQQSHGPHRECSCKSVSPSLPHRKPSKTEMLRQSPVNCVLSGGSSKKGCLAFWYPRCPYICLYSTPDLSPVPIWARKEKIEEKWRDRNRDHWSSLHFSVSGQECKHFLRFGELQKAAAFPRKLTPSWRHPNSKRLREMETEVAEVKLEPSLWRPGPELWWVPIRLSKEPTW